MSDFEIIEKADSELERAAQTLDWGVLVEETQGGVVIYIVGNSRGSASKLLRNAADALEAA